MGTNRWLKYKIEQLPIPAIKYESELHISHLVDTVLIMKTKGYNTENVEHEIEALVMAAYGLEMLEAEEILDCLKIDMTTRDSILSILAIILPSFAIANI